MSIDALVQQMTMAEKLHAMELIWAHLSNSPASLQSPAWHGAILAEREAEAKDPAALLDWDRAKRDLRAQCE